MEEKSKNNVINKVERPQNKHLKPLKKGETANPNGRPLGQKNYATLYKEALIKLAKKLEETPDDIELKIITNGLARASTGDYRFYKDVLDRLHGQATQKTEVQGNMNVSIDIEEKANEAISKFLKKK